MQEKSLKFISNWNGKLLNKFYTTIRLVANGNDKYWKHNDVVNIYIKDKIIGQGEIVEVLFLEFSKLSNVVCLLDSAMNKKQFKEFCSKIYKKTEDEIEQSKMILLLIKNIIKK